MWINRAFESERLFFCEITLKNAAQIVAWRQNETTGKYFVNRTPITLDSHLAWYGSYLRDMHRFDYIFNRKDSGLPIGTVGIIETADESKALEVSYMIGDISSQKCGFAVEAVSAVVVLAKNTGFRLVKAVINKNNIPSIALVQKLGFDLFDTSGEFETYRKVLCDSRGR